MTGPPEFGDPSRRTYLAQERTLLAWWRTGLGAIALAPAVGRILPGVAHLPRSPFLALGAGYGVLAVALFVYGLVRLLQGERVLASGGFHRLSTKLLVALTAYMVALTVLTVVALFTRSG